MKHKQKQYAGIWLDGQHAAIISSNESDEYVISARVKSPDSQSGGSEHAINNGKKTEHSKYFKDVSQHLQGFDEILIFGPGQAQEQLQNHLKSEVTFNDKQVSIDSADQLTDPQMIAKVRDFFKGK